MMVCVLECVWPRLQSSHEKPHWISIDFTHWEYQKESEDEEDEEKEDDSGSIDPAKKAQVVCLIASVHIPVCFYTS